MDTIPGPVVDTIFGPVVDTILGPVVDIICTLAFGKTRTMNND